MNKTKNADETPVSDRSVTDKPCGCAMPGSDHDDASGNTNLPDDATISILPDRWISIRFNGYGTFCFVT